MLTRYVLPFVGVCTLIFAVTQILKAQQKPEEVSPAIEPGKSPYTKQLAGSGIIEPETENILIGSHVPGVVDKLFVKVGDTIKPGDRLFQIDERTLRAEIKYRESMLTSAQAQLSKLKKMPRDEERPVNEAKVKEAEIALQDMQQQFSRVEKLGSSVSQEELSRRQLAAELAKQQLNRAKADFQLWSAGAWQYDKEISQAAVDQASAQLEQSKMELTRQTVKAPMVRWKLDSNGLEVPDNATTLFRVLQLNIRPGEYVGNNPGQAAIVLGVVGQLHVRVDIDENDIARFNPALIGIAKPRGNPDVSFKLKFIRLEPYVIPKKSLTGANTERVDTRVLQVIYALQGEQKNIFVGQQMDVFLDAGK
jgi:multidrug efflux pump subunit AcrA (membrane-fusion protein)